ncbi:MAG: DUF4040 domain-containing protein [Flavobacteriales bacterium]|nr:DUF4040 domain-containing protein [Flavobacteriales bacterium]
MGPVAILLLVVFSAAVVAPLLQRLPVRWATGLLALVPLGAFVWFAGQVSPVVDGVPLREGYVWVNGLGFDFDFRIDGLSLLFALLITGIGTLIVLYGGAYLQRHPGLPRFFTYLFVFMGSMLGVVLSDNIFALFVFWELTSLSSYLLIGYRHGHAGTRKAALQALLVTGMGGLALMAGLILATTAQGSPVISHWAVGGGELLNSPYLTPMVVLVLLGAFTKSAQFPFHFWLPNAMAAPTPVSAYLHSATMVKAGVYLLARLAPHFGGIPGWNDTLVIVGGITMLLGAGWALVQMDLKKVLAYTTISALGLLVMSIGLASTLAMYGAILFLLAHAGYKGALFMVAGNVDHGTGTRNVEQLGGLFRVMPWTGFAAALAALGMMGFPLFLGFVAKEVLYEATLHHFWLAVPLTTALFLTGAAFTAMAILIGGKVFFGPRGRTAHSPHDVGAGMWSGPVLLAALGLLAGSLPADAIGSLTHRAVEAMRPGAGTMELHAWPGITPVLGLSLLTIAAGIVLFRLGPRLRRVKRGVRWAEQRGPEMVYERGLRMVTAFAARFTALLQSGHLRYYIMVILVTFFILLLAPIHHYGLFHPKLSFAGVDPYEWLLALLVAAAVLATVAASDRLMAIAILGVVGYGVAFFFAIYGGTDMAMTQFLVETLTLLVFVYVVWKLPRYILLTSGGHRFRDITIALVGGAVMTTIILLVTDYPLVSELKLFYAENSVPLAKGRNVVNVILVDFRALDTLGEITVLSIAGLGVLALAKLKLGKAPAKAGTFAAKRSRRP